MSLSRSYEKNLLEQTEELIQSLLIIRDSVQLVMACEKNHFILPIYGQLRALLSKGKNDPLLLRLAKQYSQNLRVFRMPSIEEDADAPEIIKKAELYFGICPITTHRVLPAQIETSLEELLGCVCIRNGENRISIETVIKYFAEKSGGAHFDKIIREKDLIIAQMIPDTVLLRNLCDVVIEMGAKISQSITNQEQFIVIRIPQQDLTNRHVLIDQMIPNSQQRIQITLESSILVINCIDFMGRRLKLASDRSIPIGTRFILNYTLETTSDLQQMATVKIDNDIVASLQMSRPTIFNNTLMEYDVLYNGEHGLGASKLDIHLFELIGLQEVINETKRISLMEYLHNKPKNKFIKISSGAMGRRAPHHDDIKFEGEVRHIIQD